MILDLIITISRICEEQKLLILAVSILLYVCFSVLLQPFFLSPLRKIPGPYLHRITALPSIKAQFFNEWISKVYSLHLKYGNIVILSPNEISFSGESCYLKDIYVSNFKKGSFYVNFKNHGKRDNTFSESENSKHLKYKKILMGSYQKLNIYSHSNYIRSHLEDVTYHLICHLRKRERTSIDVGTLFSSFAMDMILAFELGSKNGTNLIENEQDRDILDWYKKKDTMTFWLTIMPNLWSFAATREVKSAMEKIEEWHLKLYAHAEIMQDPTERTSLKILRAHGFVGKDAYSFITDNIFAGHRTTANQLTYLCYELSRPENKTWKKKLKQELNEAFGLCKDHETMIKDLETLDKLPILNAIVTENLRLHSPIPGAQPRIVDRDYQVAIQGQRKSVKIPKGTIVSCLTYSMHRLEKIFNHPEYFDPSRWLQRELEDKVKYKYRISLQNRFMIPFGKGIRLCLGMNLALTEIKMVLSNIYHHFDVHISQLWCHNPRVKEKPNPIFLCKQKKPASDSHEKKMAMLDSYSSRPINDECYLVFE